MNPRIHAAQSHYSVLGLYPSTRIDGLDGPLTRKAERMYADNMSHSIPSNPSLTPYEIAKTCIGEKEIHGPTHNPFILELFESVGANWYKNDETPWCGAFVGACHLRAGYETPDPVWKSVTAKAWLNVGEEIRLSRAKPGDIVVFSRGSAGHVAFFSSYDERRETVNCLGGNQSDSVNISTYPASRLISVRRTSPV